MTFRQMGKAKNSTPHVDEMVERSQRTEQTMIDAKTTQGLIVITRRLNEETREREGGGGGWGGKGGGGERVEVKEKERERER